MKRKLTKKAALELFQQEERSFVRYVLERVDMDQMADVARNGGANGWSGFIWYTEMRQLLSRRRKSIKAILNKYSESVGEHVIKLLTCRAPFTGEEVAEALYGSTAKADAAAVSHICWLALEIVAEEIYYEQARQ